MTTLGLDIALDTGAAWDGENGTPRCSTFKAPRPRGSNDDGWDYTASFIEFHRWLSGLIAIVKPSFIAYEAPLQILAGGHAKVMTSQTTIRILFGLAAIAEMTAGEADIPVTEVNVQKVKRYLTGNGRAQKADMIAAARRLGWTVKNDHEADASGIWALAKSLRDPKWAPRSTPLFGRATA